MTKAKLENYRLAAARIARGEWKVYPETGVLTGTYGHPYRGKNSDGYIHVRFCEPGEWPKARTVLAHRVIYEHVHGEVDESLTINHINGDVTDNRVSNLEAVTQAENVKHAVRTGLYHANCWYCHHNGGLHRSDARD